MEVAEFERRHYKVAVEGRQAAHRGDKEDFGSALSFWVWSQHLVDRPRTPKASLRLAEEGMFEPLGETAWIESISFAIWQLRRPAPQFLRRIDGFVAGMRLYGGYVLGEVRSSVLAEFDDCYVAWHCRIGGGL